MALSLKLLAGMLFWSGRVAAATFYVSPSGVDQGGCSDSASPCQTLQFGISKMSGGDTLILKPGIYSGNANSLDAYNQGNFIPNGSENAYTRFMAEQDGTVEISSRFNLAMNSQYLQFEGLLLSNQEQSKTVAGHHIKILRTGFKGGPATDNEVVLGIGTNDQTPGAHHILLEDVWSYGPGGRYNLLVYNSEYVVIRRAIIRHDGGWATDCSNPEAGMTIYNSRFVELQNVIVLDSVGDNQANPCSQGFSGFYNVSNGSGGTQHENTRIVGSMALNNAVETAMAWDDSASIANARLEHSAIYNSGIGVTTNGEGKQLTLKNVTIDSGSGDGVAVYGNNNQVNLELTIIYGKSGQALRYTNQITDVVCFSNNGGQSGCNYTEINPRQSGLDYLTRIEENSLLKTQGANNSQIGATLLNQLGKSGTYFGESDFSSEQASLWPWPLQERIFNDLCNYRNSSLCASSSLTDYIWGLLGNPLPNDLQSMPIPTGFSIQKN